MARWEHSNDWPVRHGTRITTRMETEQEARRTSSALGLWMIFCAFCFGAICGGAVAGAVMAAWTK